MEAYGARELTRGRSAFLNQYVKAQVVMYEDGRGMQEGQLRGWFFWNMKMEENVYEEWDFLFGLEKGWMPHFETGVSATNMFGTCEEILENTYDDVALIDPFPPDSWALDDDITQATTLAVIGKAVKVKDSFKPLPPYCLSNPHNSLLHRSCSASYL